MKEFFQHAATTDGVTVRVAVNYLPEQSHPEAGKWFWVYHIRIENASHEALRLRTRHWRITDGRGMVTMSMARAWWANSRCSSPARAMTTSRAAR